MNVFLLFLCFLQQVASLSLTVQPNTFATHASLLLWARRPADGNGQLDFDLRFLQGANHQDAGMAISGIHASPTQQYGTAQVVFPTQGTYEIVAVSSSNNNMGTSNNVHAIVLPTTLLSATPMSTYVSVSSHHVTASVRSTQPNHRTAVIVGSTIAAIILLVVFVILIRFVIRRRHEITKRWTFHREMMVHGRPPLPMMAQTFSNASSASLASQSQDLDLEEGSHILVPVRRLPDPVVLPITVPPACRPAPRRLESDPSHRTPLPLVPIGPRLPLRQPSLPRAARNIQPELISPIPRSPTLRSPMPRPPTPRTPMPRSPSPRTHRQRAIADQIEMLRFQMLKFECQGGGGKDGTAMDKMCKKLAWLREQQEGSWALGLTDVTPLGYDRYMT